jgi:arylformamidase
MRTILVFLMLTSSVVAADPQAHRDLPYAEPKNDRQILDIYSPAEGQGHPVVVWIHGGGRRNGEKLDVQKKPQTFVDKGFVFVSINYRFVPQVAMKQIAGDVAKAIRWVHDHVKDYGGDPDSILLIGHSGGAHLAALVSTDDRYLQAEGLSLSLVKACVPIDVGFYDVPKLVKDSDVAPPDTFKVFFGGTEESQRELSPATYVAKGKNIPPFLILYVADRPDTKAQSLWFAEKLQAADVSAKAIGAEGKNHGTINSDLGLPDDKPTKELWAFLDGVLKK